MKKSLFAGATLTALFSGHALANEPADAGAGLVH